MKRSTEYHFITHWRVHGTNSQVYSILMDALGYARWWNDCYVQVDQIKKCDRDGLHGMYKILNRGWLPYTLEWYSSVISIRPPHGFTVRASGELEGEGRWIFEQDGEYVNITFFWDVHFKKRWLQHFSFLLRPIFVWNHDYVMNRGEKHLQEELLRVKGLIAKKNGVSVGFPTEPRSA